MSNSIQRHDIKCHKHFLGGLVLKLPAKLFCGAIAGATAQSFAYPFDVTRRRMQLAQMSPDMLHWRYFTEIYWISH